MENVKHTPGNWRLDFSLTDCFDELGEALFYLSDKLRGSGFLNDDANRADYEAVVSAFTKLEERVLKS